ncbi:MAG: pantetheine-phosphate adenylyltransferase [Coxiellaceae bacterium]|nr:pantetheine-phosphate adenylyltransferase [Coxiellaceae bacterium]
MITAVYPGTFDPLTNGHVDIVERGARLFDSLIIAVAKSAGKNPRFSEKERLVMCQDVFEHYKNVEVVSFDGLLVDFIKANNATIILRGLRSAADLDFEFQLSGMNQAMYPECETVFIKASDMTSSISSSMVREVAAMGGDVALFVPPAVAKRMR